MNDPLNDSERRRQQMRAQLAKLHTPTPEADLTPEQQYGQDLRDYRLLAATLDGDEERADKVLDEEPSDLSPRVRAGFKENATNIVERLEAEHGRDGARALIEAELTRVLDEAEQHRDPIGYAMARVRADDIAAGGND